MVLHTQSYSLLGSAVTSALRPVLCSGVALLQRHLPALGSATAAIQQRHMSQGAPEDVNSFVREVSADRVACDMA